MPTLEIPRNEWATFLEGFSRRYLDWQVTIEVFDPHLGTQVEAQDLSLAGMSTVLKGADTQMLGATPPSISINVSGAPPHAIHTIGNPTHLWLKQTAAGEDEALEIESANGTTTLIRFHFAVLPELVDAIAWE